MYSWLVTVLLLASAANGSGGQGAGGESIPFRSVSISDLT